MFVRDRKARGRLSANARLELNLHFLSVRFGRVLVWWWHEVKSTVEYWLQQDESGDDYINEEYGWKWISMVVIADFEFIYRCKDHFNKNRETRHFVSRL